LFEDNLCAQTIGMYLLENNTIFRLSTAHGLVQADPELWFSMTFASKERHVGSIGPLYFHSPLNGRWRWPTPYVAFPLPRKFLVDIMVGPVMPLPDSSQLNTRDLVWRKATIMNNSDESRLLEVRDTLKLVSYSWVTEDILEEHVDGTGNARFILDRPRFLNTVPRVIYIKSSNIVIPRQVHSGCVWLTCTAERRIEAVAITNGIM